MTMTTYLLEKFDFNRANGALCVVIDIEAKYVKPGDSISNVTIENGQVIPTNGFIGAGICRKTSDSKYAVVINGTSYTFDSFGNGILTKCVAFLGVVKDKNTNAGDVVNSSTTTTTTRGMTPEGEEWNTTVSGEGQTTVSNLSARDHFAIHALRGMLARIDDPSVLGDNEIRHYCDAAYQWAANMMTVAANSRATLTVEKEGEGASSASNVHYEEVDVPETNTEKFLNNIVYALQRTDAVIGEEPVLIDGEPTGETTKIIAERLTAPNIENWLKDYKVLYKYRNVQEATEDNWHWGNDIWTKEGYDSVGGEYTNDAAKDLPTWRKVVKVSVVEMPDLIQAIKDLTIQVKRIADDKEPVDVFDETFDGSFHPNTNSN